MRQKIKDAVKAEFPNTVQYRRYIHQNPCLSFEEGETADYICKQLEQAGIDYERCGLNGIVARIKGKKEGPCIAFRADFDALPIQEPEGLPFASCKKGVMHACGHDFHAASLLSLARIFRANQEWVCGEVVFIFQYAEELPPGGAAPMIEAGCLEGVDRIYGMHVSDELDSGDIGICPGKYMAASDHFIVEFTGSGGHGSRPGDTQDTVSAAASAVLQINSIVSRFISPLRSAVISVCNVHGGQVYNIIPATVRLEATVRSYEAETTELIIKHIRNISESCANIYGTGCNFEYEYGYSAVVNSLREADIVSKASEKMGLKVRQIEPTPVGEDFSAYLEKIPGAFFRVGIRNEALDAVYPLHNRKFKIDEDAFVAAMEAFLGIYFEETEQL